MKKKTSQLVALHLQFPSYGLFPFSNLNREKEVEEDEKERKERKRQERARMSRLATIAASGIYEKENMEGKRKRR